MSKAGLKIIQGYDSLKADRATFDGKLRDITYYALPEYESQNDATRGDDTPDRPVSSTATNAAVLLGGHLFSHTVSTGDEWFSLRGLQEDEDDREAKEWLSHAQKKAIKAIQNSNFAEAYGEMCTLYGTFGTGCLSNEFDKERMELVFRNHSVNGNLYFTEDERGRVCGVYRKLRYTADQAKSRYGKLPEKIAKAFGDPSRVSEKFDFVQCVVKNPDYNPKRKDSLSLRYRSTHVYCETEDIVLEEGFRTFPFACPRFIKLRDFAYGYGSGHMALNAIRELNKAEADFIDAVEMESHPPLWLPDEEAVESAEIRPSYVGYFDPSMGTPFQMKIGGNAAALFQRIQQLRQEITQMFFIDVFLSVSQRWGEQKTAREVEEISQEKLSSIGPMVSRLQSECFSPLIERVVDLLIEAEVITPPPASIAGQGFRVIYTSRIDSKLATIEVNQTLQAVSEAQALLKMEMETPELDDVFTVKDAAQSVLEKRNVNMKLIVPKIERKKKEQARNEAAAPGRSCGGYATNGQTYGPDESAGTRKPG